MDLHQLSAFMHIAQTGNFSQSAKALNMSQPTLSRHIAQLEQALGQTLIHRTHRPMTLTPVGTFFYQHAQKSVNELNELITLTQNFGKSPTDTLTIGFVASILYGLLPDVIGELKSKLPNLTIKLLEVGSNEQPTALKAGQIDVGFGRLMSSDAFIRQTFLRHEKLMVALPCQHKLATKKSLSFSVLADEMLILYHRTPLILGEGKTLDPLLRLFHERHLYPTHTQKASDIQIALGLVSAGEGITLVPMSLKGVRREQIAYVPLESPDATFPIYLNTLNNTEQLNPNIHALLDATYAVYQAKNIEHQPYSANL